MQRVRANKLNAVQVLLQHQDMNYIGLRSGRNWNTVLQLERLLQR